MYFEINMSEAMASVAGGHTFETFGLKVKVVNPLGAVARTEYLGIRGERLLGFNVIPEDVTVEGEYEFFVYDHFDTELSSDST